MSYLGWAAPSAAIIIVARKKFPGGLKPIRRKDWRIGKTVSKKKLSTKSALICSLYRSQEFKEYVKFCTAFEKCYANDTYF